MKKNCIPIDPWQDGDSCNTETTRRQEPRDYETNCDNRRNKNGAENDQQWSSYGECNDGPNKDQAREK